MVISLRHCSLMFLPARANRLVCMIIAILAVAGCSSLAPQEEQEKRAELDAMSESTLLRVFEEQPGSKVAYEQCVGYAIVAMIQAKIPMVGTGKGYGIVIDKRNEDREYVEVSQFEVGGGMGAQRYTAVVFFRDEARLKKAMTGFWHFEAGAEAAAGDTRKGGSASSGKGYQAYKITESGAVATLTVRAVRARPL